MRACASRCRFRASGVEGEAWPAAVSRRQRASGSLAGRVWVIDVEVGIDALAGLLAQLTRAFAARGGFPGDGGSKQPHRTVLLHELGFKLARLSQLRVDVVPPSAVRREERLAPHPGAVQFPGRGEPLRRQLLLRSRRFLGRWRVRQSIPARDRSFRRWSRRSSQTSSPWRRGTAGTSLGQAHRRSPTPRTRVRWRVVARWRSRGTPHHRRRRWGP
jgi:hypothetical protein